MKTAAFVTRRRYSTQRIEHAFLEPEAALAVPWSKDGEPGVKIYDGGQGGYEDRRQIAELLDLPERAGERGPGAERRRLRRQGGPHGPAPRGPALPGHGPARSCSGSTAGCPCACTPSATPSSWTTSWAATGTAGWWPWWRSMHSDTGRLRQRRHEGDRAGRGPLRRGLRHPQRAREGHRGDHQQRPLRRHARVRRQPGLLRHRVQHGRAVRPGRLRPLAVPLGQRPGGRQGHRHRPGAEAAAWACAACLEALKDRFQAAKYAGIAAGIKNTGIGCGMPDFGRAKIGVEGPDKVVLHHGWCEMGQGAHNMALQTLVTETGIDPAIVEVRVETDAETCCGMTTASRGTSLVGNSVRVACPGAEAGPGRGPDPGRPGRAGIPGRMGLRLDHQGGLEPPPGKEIVTHYSYGYAAQMVELDDTGRITRITAAHDAGRILNPTLFEGQIEGSLHMGLGYAVTEDFPYRDGWPVSWKMADLGIIRAKDMPPMEVIGVEVPDAHGPYGAKGVGEIGLVPTAPAVANALCHFDGIRRTTLPLREMQLLGKKNKN